MAKRSRSPLTAPVTASIQVQDLSHTYKRRGESLQVLKAVTFEVEQGGYVSLVGPSGSGKSTLLSVLGGLERPQQGAIVVEDHDLTTLTGDALADYRRTTVGFVFQHFGLLSALTAVENLELALTLSRVPGAQRRRRAGELLERVGLADRLHHRPAQLSGGERQRVAIARALANEPRVILADEPTGNLDDETATTVIELLETLPAQQGCTLLLVTHNKTIAARATQRLALLAGVLRARGSDDDEADLVRPVGAQPARVITQ
jgi:putative ABC transport system ATP-binding protein